MEHHSFQKVRKASREAFGGVGGMAEPDDTEYFQMMAEQELELARKAELRSVASAHHRMACAYLDRLDDFDPSSREAESSAVEGAARKFPKRHEPKHRNWPPRRR